MNTILEAPAAWDLLSALGNAKNYAQQVGGAVIMLIGVILICVSAYKMFKYFSTARGKQEESLFTCGAILFLGGAFAVGGFSLMMSIAEGGKTTIEQLGGGGTALIDQLAITGKLMLGM